MAEFRMPSLGADMDEGTLLEWLVQPGDEVHKGDIVAVVDTAKAAVEVECFEDGVVGSLLVEPGHKVPVGTALATIEPAGAARARPTPPPAAPVPPPVVSPVEPAAPPGVIGRAAGPPAKAGPLASPSPAASPLVRQLARRKGVDLTGVHGSGAAGTVTRADVERAATPKRPRVSPLARRIAAEAGIDLSAIEPTGAGGAIRAEDVRRAVRASAPAPPAAQAPVTTSPQPRPAEAAGEAAGQRADAMRQAIARLMARSKREIPHYYLTATIDLDRATRWLHDRNRELPVSARLVPAALLLKAAACAARAVPQLNGYWIDDHFAPAEHVHLGVAISLRGGGMVAPAIHDADQLAVADLMTRLRDLVTRAREGRLRGSEMTDATITVTNLGDRGAESVLGVIYPPQVALAGFGKVVTAPCAVGGLIGVHPQVTATLAADHRATDGYTGARYLEAVGHLLQEPQDL